MLIACVKLLIYMSTLDILKKHVIDGTLKQFIPTAFFGEEPQRGMYMPTALHDLIHKVPEGKDELERLSFIKEKLAVFANGEWVDNKYYMRRLYKRPYGIWEIYIRPIVPEYRIFGMFALPDVFICSHITPRASLGRFRSEEWKNAKREAELLWNDLFSDAPRFHADHFCSYVTINGGHYDW